MDSLKTRNNRVFDFKLIFISTIFIAFLIFLDQISKIYISDRVINDGAIILIEGVLELTYLENTGAAFSFLTGKSILFIVIVPIILIFIFFVLVKTPKTMRYMPIRIILLFIIAGAIGNYIDRILFGYVRDFIYFSLIDFPVFNVADIYVTCSVFVFLFLSIFYYKDGDLDYMFSLKKGPDNPKDNHE